jgi:probable phosphoglycerate mutase
MEPDVPVFTMTTCLLIRHAAHILGGEIIAGRSPHAFLSPLGKEQVSALVDRLAHVPIRAVYSSPVTRAVETATPLAQRLALPLQTSDALREVEFGQWEGRRMDELRPQPRWRQWNSFRSGTRIPGGELMAQTQLRIVDEILRLAPVHPDQCIALVSHGDVIKAVLAYFLGIPLDLFTRIEISLASVSALSIGDYGPWITCINNTGDIALPGRI